MPKKNNGLLHLPTRQGVSPSSIALVPGAWPTVLDFLETCMPHLPDGEWLNRLQAGDVLTPDGQAVSPYTSYMLCQQQHAKLHYWRSVRNEQPIPFEATVIYQDEFIVVADKPHFLPIAPVGNYVQETLLVRLKQQLGIADLTPMHRLDRETAGLIVFTVQKHTRQAYQTLFKEHKVLKTYEAVAAWRNTDTWPKFHASHLCRGKHFMQVVQMPGPINTETEITLLDHCTQQQLGLYQLKPISGHRHQLRVHMCALGLPLLNDRIYPVLQQQLTAMQCREMSQAQIYAHLYEKPLQLLAKSLSFKDPVSGKTHYFESQRNLEVWDEIKLNRQKINQFEPWLHPCE